MANPMLEDLQEIRRKREEEAQRISVAPEAPAPDAASADSATGNATPAKRVPSNAASSKKRPQKPPKANAETGSEPMSYIHVKVPVSLDVRLKNHQLSEYERTGSKPSTRQMVTEALEMYLDSRSR